MNDQYLSAEEAARALGVSVPTLYAYVGRKGIRSRPVPGSRAHQYWRADVERIAKQGGRLPLAKEPGSESAITLLTDAGPHYRGVSALELAQHASLEAVASLLWEAREAEVFTDEVPKTSAKFAELDRVLVNESSVDRAVAHFPFLERANPRSYDLSQFGMARTGSDVMRWLTAIMLRQPQASMESIHLQFGRAFRLPDVLVDLTRRFLVLAADHGFEQSASAVRAVASMGVTPWRSVATGLAVGAGRRSKFRHSDALSRFIDEVISAHEPEERVLRRLREGEEIPGFSSPVYSKGDPRGRALLDHCEVALPDDPSYRRLKRVLVMVKEVQGLEPNFALAGTFLSKQMGFSMGRHTTGAISTITPYLVGRSAGWIAHAIEQYRSGEAEHIEPQYRGPLPAPRR